LLRTIALNRRSLGAGLALLASVTLVAPCSTVPVIATPSLNWSGYALAGSHFTGVTGTFNVPVPNGPTSCVQETVVWVGVDGMRNHDLLQAGVSESGFIVPASQGSPPWVGSSVVCTGHAEFYAWWEDLPSQLVRVGLPVRAGDRVSVSIFEMSPGWWAVAVHNLTAHRALFLSQPYSGPQTSVEWVVEAPELVGMFANPVPFTTVSFSYLGAQGQAREVVKFGFGSKGNSAFSPSVVVNMAQLMRRGFQVRWVNAARRSADQGPSRTTGHGPRVPARPPTQSD
jgi:Peptidase A4 family